MPNSTLSYASGERGLFGVMASLQILYARFLTIIYPGRLGAFMVHGLSYLPGQYIDKDGCGM